jgi:hypothetical protein
MDPKCARCEGTVFGITSRPVPGRNYPVNLIHCVECGDVVGATEVSFLEALIRKFARASNVQL